MKNLLTFLLCLLGWTAEGQTNTNPPPMPPTNSSDTVPLTLLWEYPTNNIPQYVIIAQAPVLAWSNTLWTVLTVQPSSNLLSSNLDGSNAVFSFGVTTVPGEQFWKVYASNFWGTTEHGNFPLTGPAAIIGTPPLPKNPVKVSITH